MSVSTARLFPIQLSYTTMQDKNGHLDNDTSSESVEPVNDSGVFITPGQNSDMNTLLTRKGIANYNTTGIIHIGNRF